MATETNLPFSWEQVDKLSDLRRLELVLDAVADTEIINALREMRGNGRNEYPVAAMWRALIAGIVFGHESVESLIRELNRNSSLLCACGFSSVPLQSRPRYRIEPSEGRAGVIIIDSPPRSPAPKSSNFSRFLSNAVSLEERRGLVSKMIEGMRGELMELLGDFGENPGYDGKAIESHSTGQRSRKTGETSRTPRRTGGSMNTPGLTQRAGRGRR